MFTGIETFWMHVVANAATQQTIFLTVPFAPEFGAPQPNVSVLVALTGYSQGVDLDAKTTGAVGANVTIFEFIDAAGQAQIVDLPKDFSQNAVHVDRCLSFTVALSATRAWAFAAVTVLFRD